MNLETIKAHLNNSIEKIDSTFQMLNLNLIGVNVMYVNDNGYFYIGAEVSSIDNQKIKEEIEIKIVCYDADNNIVDIESKSIYPDEFVGYDAIEFYFQRQQNIAFNTEKIRIFATKG